MRRTFPPVAFVLVFALLVVGPASARGQDPLSAASATADGRTFTAAAGIQPSAEGRGGSSGHAGRARATGSGALRPSVGPSFAVGFALENPEYGAAPTLARTLDEIVASGARWIRIDVKWADVQWHGRSSYNWSKYDALIGAAHARGLLVLGNLAYSPTWARPRGRSDKFAPNTRWRRAAFARFAGAAARRYRGRVQAWEIWNEPNNPIFWQPRPNAASYAALVRRAYRALKRRAPGVTVLAGATAPARTAGGWIDEVTFLRRFYRAGGRRHFDAWSHHPYDFELPPGTRHKHSAWWQTYGARPSIRSVMRKRGDGAKKVWATEYGLPSAGYPGVSEAVQARWLGRAFAKWRAFPWGGPVFNYMLRDGAAGGVASYWYHIGVLRSDWTRKPAFGVMQQAASSP